MKNKDNSISQESFVYQWFLARPDRDIPHSESKQQIESEWFQAFETRFEDVDRAIRRLSQEGKLQKITKGVYRLTNDYKHKPKDGFSDLCRICEAPSRGPLIFYNLLRSHSDLMGLDQTISGRG